MEVDRWVCALAAMAASGVVAAPVTDAPAGPRVPPRMVKAAGGYDDCQVATPQPVGPETEVYARLTVAADGSLGKISLAESATEWMAQLTACVLRRTEFRAALRDGAAVESTASLHIALAAGAGGDSTARVVAVGPLITAPTMKRRDPGPIVCYPIGVDVADADARKAVRITILPDGSKGGLKLPADSPDWLEGSALCTLSRLEFEPGTVDALPVTSEATLPIVFRDAGSQVRPEYRLTAPRLASSEEQEEAAYRACYPPVLQTTTRVHFQFEIGTGGHVRNPEVVKGSGDARIDEVAKCVLGKLKFTPMLRGSRRVEATVTWALWVRPPRNS